MIVSLDNLKAGLGWWQNSKFPKDIHNADYYEIYDARHAGPTRQWWDATVERLTQWKAYRGPRPPNTKADITARGIDRLGRVAAQYKKLVSRSTVEPCIEDHCWEDVATLYAIVSGIKPGSHVFAGKTCHFLFPKLFTVMDNLATNVFDYEFYWRGMKDEWHRLKEKVEARNLLTEAIRSRSDRPLHPQFPLGTKIIELCHIGHKGHLRAIRNSGLRT